MLGEPLHTVPSLPSGNLASSRSERLTARLEAFTLNPFQDFLDPVLVMRHGVLGRFVRCAVDVQQELSQLNFTILKMVNDVDQIVLTLLELAKGVNQVGHFATQ